MPQRSVAQQFATLLAVLCIVYAPPVKAQIDSKVSPRLSINEDYEQPIGF